MTEAKDFPYETLSPHVFSLSRRRALVTGAGGHLGSAISVGLAMAGAHVEMIGRNLDKLAKVKEQIVANGGSASIEKVDLFDELAVTEYIADRVANKLPLDILVNNAYSGKTGTLEQATSAQFLDAYQITVAVAAELVRGLLPCLRAGVGVNGDASVINIASMYGSVSPDPSIYGNSGQNSPPYYGAAKGALIQYTRYASVHLAHERIRVNAISPGPMPPLDFREQKPEFYAELLRKVPLKRIGLAADVVGPVVFLASPAAQFITGVNLPVDGGWTSW